jgi:DNA-binding PadR family transcriptional regulator
MAQLANSASALGYALLCLLERGPSTGYELAGRLRRPVGYYWTARHSQVYPELARLVDTGLVRYAAGSGPGPREKKTYTITAAGRAALAAWLVRPPTPRLPKDELLLKTYAVGAAEPRRMARLYLDMADECGRVLAQYRGMLVDLADDGATDRLHAKFGNYATLRLGVATEEQRLGWCLWMASTLMDER